MLKGALVGYGFIGGKGHFPAYLERAVKQKDFCITTVVDICPARRAIIEHQFPEMKVYANYLDLMMANRAGNESIDFVDISAPPYVHAQYAKMALELGLHVLCEKPLTTTLEEAHLLLGAAQRSRGVLFPCHNYKHAPVVKKVKSVIQSGQIGKVRSLSLTTLRNTHAKGVLEWDTHWRRKPEYSGGGIAMDHGSHTFYLTFDWMQSYPLRVSARQFYRDPKWVTEDNVTATLEFPNGLAHVHLSWTAGMRKVIYSVQGEKGGLLVNDDEIEISVQKQAEKEDVAQGAVEWVTQKDSIASNWMDASHVTWFHSLLDSFSTAINEKSAGKTHLPQDLTEAYRCIELIEAIELSSSQGGKIVDLRGPQQ